MTQSKAAYEEAKLNIIRKLAKSAQLFEYINHLRIKITEISTIRSIIPSKKKNCYYLKISLANLTYN